MCEKCLFKSVCKNSDDLPFECEIFETETEYNKNYSNDLRTFIYKSNKKQFEEKRS